MQGKLYEEGDEKRMKKCEGKEEKEKKGGERKEGKWE
jgi:hypothetical protein